MFRKKSLVALEDLTDGESTALSAKIKGVNSSLIVVRRQQQVFVYLNTCPHVGAPLDFEPGRFLNLEKDLIQCALHGALFTIEQGNCVSGPCEGKHLTAVPIEMKKGSVYLK
ncbi:MAG: Rieske 2Fe-2S domain-containing protein [Magnetovibrio sp.]|nr:Rieske 2Fe-2S domain-containing protein [Magnetovibrio sp.]